MMENSVEERERDKNEVAALAPEIQDKIKPDTDIDEKHIEDIDTIELAISEIVNQVENKKVCAENSSASASLKQEINSNIDDNFIVIESSEVNDEENKARVALQQLESINSSSRRKKKHEIGSVVCTKKLQTSTLDNDDLIAILQGTDDIVTKNGNGIKEEVIIEGEGHFEVLDIIDDDKNRIDETVDNSGDSLNLQKNRKRKQDFKSDLVSSLVSEWSDDEDTDKKSSDVTVEEPTIQEENVSSEMKIPEITPFKRTRVIKRKIIWDPDAPETQFSYASLIQPKNKVSPNQTKDQTKKRVTSPVRKKLVSSSSSSDRKTEPAEKKPKNTGPLAKKKKQSEIDRLLGDEGAANMLNSLEQQAENSTIFENKNKRASSKSKPSENWDYVYNSTSVDSMIARRRSTSSYSSTSPHRNSFDATPSNTTQTKSDKSNEAKKKTKQFEFAKPEAKKAFRKDEEGEDNFQSYDMVSEIKKSVEKKKNHENSKQSTKAKKDLKDDDVVLKKNGNVFNLLVDTKSSKSKNMFTIKMLKKIGDILDDLVDDDECKVVLFSSSGQNFCQGIDFSDLVNATEKRNKTCQEWTEIIFDFFRSLIKFTKPLIAAVQGNVSGLGVMMIPLFDITICSEKSIFETGYIKSGQFPEGYCFFNATVNTNLVKKMIWLGEKISSSEAVSHAFITKTTTPQRTFEETLSYAKKMCTYSQEVYKNIKKARFSKIGTTNILDQLKSDEQALSSSLISETFCDNYKSFISRGSW